MLRTANSQFRRLARPGFTLVEMMVMAAVVVLIMAVLASVFGTGLDAVRHVRAAGDMMDQLRAANTVLKQDLAAEHFSPSPAAGQSNERRRVSDYRFDVAGTTAPSGGFFKVVSPGSFLEGSDLDGIQSYRAVNHQLHFTSVLPGGQSDKVYSATIAGTTYTSPAAEIAYFLVADTGQYTDGPGTQQLYKLHRRQRLLAVNAVEKQTLQAAVVANPSATPQEVISTNGATVYTMADMTTSGNRLSLPSTLSTRVGDDILLSNVLSFEVKVLYIQQGSPYPSGATYSSANTDFPFGNLASFDTASSPQQRVRAVQIRLRVFDRPMKMARQSTIVVEV